MRINAGLQYSGIEQTKKDGKKVRLNHFQFPIGIELALIPLGTPHTRYVILRAGVSAHYVDANQDDKDFDNSLLGLRGSWNLGLGYEWQFSNSHWRFHVLAEGQKSISKEKGSEFVGAGLSFGFAYTL